MLRGICCTPTSTPLLLDQLYRLHNRGFNYYKYWLLSIVNETSVFSKIIFLIQHLLIDGLPNLKNPQPVPKTGLT